MAGRRLVAAHGRGGELHLHAADPALDERVSIALYRMVQEALTNIARHAHATEVCIEMRQSRQRAAADGAGQRHRLRRGRDVPRGLARPDGHARARAACSAAQMEIGNAPGGGGRVTVRLPLAHRAAGEAPARRRHARADAARKPHESTRTCDRPGLLLVDDHTIVREGLRRILEAVADELADRRGGQRLPGAGVPAPPALRHGHRRPVDAGHERAGADQAHQVPNTRR